MQVLIIAAGARLEADLQRFLARAGHVVHVAADVAKGQRTAAEFDCDAILLCGTAAAHPTLHFVGLLKALCPTTALIALARGADVEDVCALLERGCDDVVVQPLADDLMLARLMAAVRRVNGHAGSDISVGSMHFNIGTRHCRVGTRDIHLTPMENRLVESLALRKGQLVARTRLLELLYGARPEPFPKAIDLFVHNIRAKFAAAFAAVRLDTWDKSYVLREIPTATV